MGNGKCVMGNECVLTPHHTKKETADPFQRSLDNGLFPIPLPTSLGEARKISPPLEESVEELTPPPPLPGKTGRGERSFGVLRHKMCRKTPNPLFFSPFPLREGGWGVRSGNSATLSSLGEGGEVILTPPPSPGDSSCGLCAGRENGHRPGRKRQWFVFRRKRGGCSNRCRHRRSSGGRRPWILPG